MERVLDIVTDSRECDMLAVRDSVLVVVRVGDTRVRVELALLEAC